jgi:hypothetical protein
VQMINGVTFGTQEYFSHKGYQQIIGINDASPIFRWMWKS